MSNFWGSDQNDLTDYIKHLHQTYQPKTIKRKIATLKAFTHYLYYNDIIEFNPFDKIDTSFKEPLRLPRTIPEHIIRQLLTISYKNIKNAMSEYHRLTAIRNTAIIELLFATGARISEICSLKTEDIDLTARTVLIFGKGSKERIIQIENDDVIAILRQYMQAFSDCIRSDGYFFLNNRHTRISEQSVRTIIKNLEKQINSPIHITPHMFRHSVATLLLEEDVDIRYIQRILGHSSINTTQIYTHVTSSKQKEILRTKHPRNKIHI
ncbi:MAG: tyrosine-type recombinase/integrase [Clostridia bacterium]|nr:tyrosine-type recombinase/integrase [Clostridia bacterium]